MIRPLTAHSYHLWLAVLAILASTATPLRADVIPPAHQHSWYDGKCCNNNDCGPIFGMIRERKDGYYIQTLDMLVPYGDSRIKQSKDFDFHICLYPETFADPALRNTIRCLYVPGRNT